jgi:hypothetical protein
MLSPPSELTHVKPIQGGGQQSNAYVVIVGLRKFNLEIRHDVCKTPGGSFDLPCSGLSDVPSGPT